LKSRRGDIHAVVIAGDRMIAFAFHRRGRVVVSLDGSPCLFLGHASIELTGDQVDLVTAFLAAVDAGGAA
jgi:hypothetical protein